MAICALFFSLQVGALDYGTTINNLPHITRYKVKNVGAAVVAIDRRNFVLNRTPFAEGLDKQMLRFKLYSIEADEVINIISLARMKPAKFEFDPGQQQYGGGYLYPLGVWMHVLSKLKVLRIGPLAEMVANPDRFDGVYVYGRLFVLIFSALSGLVFFLIARRLVSIIPACLMLGLYFAAPATVMFSQIMKPHWYAMFWVNMAILLGLRAYQDRRFGWFASFLTGVAIGLAVGSAQTFALFAVVFWLALALAVRRGRIDWVHLITIPVVALLVFAITNPYLILEMETYSAERSATASKWFALKLHPKYLGHFVIGSLLPGIGIALTLLLLWLASWRLVTGATLDRAGATVLIVVVILIGYLNAALSHWHINLRYAPYLLGLGILFVGVNLGARRSVWLSLCLVLTVLQSVPMWLAYRDEDQPAHSTRLGAARWIDVHVATTTGVLVGTGQPAPYEVPPFDFARYRINARDWQFQVRVERQPGRSTVPAGTKLVARFVPRLTTKRFPFVYSHINPQISIYKRN